MITKPLQAQKNFRLIRTTDEPVDTLSQSVLIQGDAKDALRLLPYESVQTVVTSPPYWSLRDYDVDQQTGCDETLEDYISRIVKTFDEIRRILKKDGTV